MNTTHPTLLINKEQALKNIEMMAKKAHENGIEFRPHFKTHQSLEVGNWFRDFGVNKITVSSVTMAHYFAQDGWSDITIAFPFNSLESSLLNAFTENIHLTICMEAEKPLSSLLNQLKRPVNVLIKTDIGYHRTGINPTDQKTITGIIEKCRQYDYLNWIGFLGHAGHSYQCKTNEEILNVHSSSTAILKQLKSTYGGIASCGDTPTCSVASTFNGIDEIRPGNFVYYDLSQYYIGSCALNQIAVALACPVVATHPKRNQAVLYGGGVHFSKDRAQDEADNTVYGLMVQLTNTGWELMNDAPKLVSLSQEHAILEGDATHHLKPGDVVGILPVHSCMAADCLKDKEWVEIV